MAQDVVRDWQNRDFIETVEVSVRKCVDFLNNFHESAKYRLSVVDARLSTLERKLDCLEASLENADPGKRNAKPQPFKGSIFDPETRRKLIAQNEQLRQQNKRKFNSVVLAPDKRKKNKKPQTQTPQPQPQPPRSPKQAKPASQPQSQPKPQSP